MEAAKLIQMLRGSDEALLNAAADKIERLDRVLREMEADRNRLLELISSKELSGSLRVSRLSSTDPTQDNLIIIHIQLDSMIKPVRVLMRPENFGIAVTGLSAPCEIER